MSLRLLLLCRILDTMKLLVVTVAALLLVSGCAAQNNFTRVDSGIPHTAAATAQSKQLNVSGNGGASHRESSSDP
jgi:uncharacterized protein YceK